MRLNRREFLAGLGIAPAFIVAANLMPVWRPPAVEIFTGFDVQHPFDYIVGATNGQLRPEELYGLGEAGHGEVLQYNDGYWMYIGQAGEGKWRELNV